MKKKKISNREYVIYSLLAASFVVFLFAGYWTWIFHRFDKLTESGTFGDSFGAINALFTGLAFAGVILTIILQGQELKETRREFIQQNRTLSLQRFENTFFNLVTVHHQIVNAIEEFIGGSHGGSFMIESAGDHTLRGRVIFKRRYKNLKSQIEGKLDNLEDAYNNTYKYYNTDFGHYFRNLYRIIKLIHETEFQLEDQSLSDEQIFEIKYKYTSIIRAQLSDFELAWLFYNCVTKNGKEKFKPLIERYSLLKNLPWTELASIHHIKLYDPKAYKLDAFPDLDKMAL